MNIPTSSEQPGRRNSMLPWIILALFLLAAGGVALAYEYHRRTTMLTGAETHTPGEVRVTFDSVVVDRLPVKFYAQDALQTTMVGEDSENIYYLENLSDQTIYIRPQHSVSAYDASVNFKLTKCFCFNDQSLEPHEKKEFTVIYRFTKGLSESTHSATMRYVIHRIQESDLRPAGTLPIVK